MYSYLACCISFIFYQNLLVNLEEVDKLLAEWKRKLDVVGQNLIDLHGLSTYQRLCGVSGFPKVTLSGVTLSRVTPALQVMHDLFQYFELLAQTVEKAIQIRTSLSKFLASQQRIQEIVELFTNPSIQLSIVPVPLAQRNLLSSPQSTNSITPEELLQLMINSFQVAKDVVFAVEEIWLRLEPKLYDIEVDIRRLQRQAEELNVDCVDELLVISQNLSLLRTNIESDPLGVNEEFFRIIQPQILKIQVILKESRQQRQTLQQELINARNQLSELLKIHHQAEAAFDESKMKIAESGKLIYPAKSEEIQALLVWLEKLEIKFNEGLFNPVRVGLQNWTIKVKEYIASEQRAYIVNKGLVETRAELRGRLDALQAKALGLGLVEDGRLVEIALQAKQLLFAQPTFLERATELVLQYEKYLNNFPK
jgi:hypothetical protein